MSKIVLYVKGKEVEIEIPIGRKFKIKANSAKNLIIGGATECIFSGPGQIIINPTTSTLGFSYNSITLNRNSEYYVVEGSTVPKDTMTGKRVWLNA